MSIQLLPDHVVAQVRSSATVTTLNHVVRGLVANSLDAQAARITISVDYARGCCTVEDDGLGIPPSEFSADGGLAKSHYTSKYPPIAHVHGSSGIFIASVAALSLLSIASRHHAHHSHNSLKLHNSAVIARHTPCLDGSQLIKFNHGTRVSVRDLFGSMPVRVKQRAIDADRGSATKECEHLQRILIALLLAWPRRVNISLYESTTVQPVTLRSSESDPTHPGTGAYASRVSLLLQQARLCDDANSSWVPLKAAAGQVSLEGAVSLDPVASKRAQFISLGIRPISNELGTNILYEEANRVFANSGFGVEENATADRSREDGRTLSYTNRDLKARKGVDRWPMFYVQVNLRGQGNFGPDTQPDTLLDGRPQTLSLVVDLIKTVMYEFLRRHHFRPTHFKHSRVLQWSSDVSRTTRSSREPMARTDGLALAERTTKRNLSQDRPRPTSPFDTWTRVKAGSSQAAELSKKQETDCAEVSRSMNPLKATLDSPALFGDNGQLLRVPFPNAEQENPDRRRSSDALGQSSHTTGDSTVEWWNPTTQEISLVDTQTGFLRHRPGPADVQKSPPKKQRLSQAKPAAGKQRSPWLQDVFATWQDPLFQPTEPPIPAVSDAAIHMLTGAQSGGCLHADASGLVVAPGSSVDNGRISKQALRQAKVISQVDRKFVLAQVASESGAETMLLIDQHAADERFRVESILKDYFCPVDADAEESEGYLSARSELLEKPLKFDIKMADAQQLEMTSALFQRWGISFQVKTEAGKTTPGLEVVKLPPSILERCRAEPRLLIELLRKESWACDAAGGKQVEQAEKGLHWLTRFHGCPKGILDMINSRACRSAIMFNDELSREECEGLVNRLAGCTLPFQCAHGRPSMVPLLELGEPKADVFHNPHGDFSRAYKRWTRRN